MHWNYNMSHFLYTEYIMRQRFRSSFYKIFISFVLFPWILFSVYCLCNTNISLSSATIKSNDEWWQWRAANTVTMQWMKIYHSILFKRELHFHPYSWQNWKQDSHTLAVKILMFAFDAEKIIVSMATWRKEREREKCMYVCVCRYCANVWQAFVLFYTQKLLHNSHKTCTEKLA